MFVSYVRLDPQLRFLRFDAVEIIRFIFMGLLGVKLGSE